MSNFDRVAYNRAGQMYSAANVSEKSVSAVSTAATGLILYNPVGSNKVLLIVDAGFVFTTAPAAVHNLGLAIMPPNITAPTGLTAVGSGVLSSNGSGNAGTAAARCYDAATLPAAPVVQRWSFGAVYGSAVGISPSTYIDVIDGALMVQPGGALAFARVTTASLGMASIAWVEIAA